MHRRHTFPELSLRLCLSSMSATPTSTPRTEDGFPTSLTTSYHERLERERDAIYEGACALTDIEAHERRMHLSPEEEKYRPFAMPSEIVDLMRAHRKVEMKTGGKHNAPMMTLEDRWVGCAECEHLVNPY
jgi:formate dehydrogenase assembly factor FdhD